MKHGSYSRCSTALQCGHLYHLKYELGWRTETRQKAPTLGSWVHAGLEAAVRAHPLVSGQPGAPVRDALRNISGVSVLHDRNEYPEVEIEGEGAMDDLCDLATSITHRVIDSAGIADGRWETIELDGVPLIEHKLEVPIPGTDIPFIGIIDWCARDTDTGLVWLIDWKVRGNFNDEESESFDPQMALYQHMLKMHGIEVAGTCTYQIRNRELAVPKMLKNGTAMSRGAIATDWPTYRQAVIDAGLYVCDYHDMEAKLKPFDRPVFVHRGADVCEGVWEQMSEMSCAQAIAPLTIWKWRNLSSFSCPRCDFREPCIEGLAGREVDPKLYGITTPKERGDA